MTYKDLIKLGLNEKEARVYLASLELGETNIERISKKSGVKRTTVYDIIDSLKEKGLMSSVAKKKKKFYYARDPRLMEESFEEKKQALKKILPDLLSLANFIDRKPRIRFFEGVGGVEEIYKEMLSYPNQEILAWMCDSPMLELSGEFWDFFANFYIPQRKKRRINLRSINSDEKGIEEYQKRGAQELRQTKLVDHNEFPIKSSINLFGGRNISIVSFREKIGLIIESEKIYMTLKSIFEMNWKALG